MDKSAYEIWKARKHKLNYLNVFGSRCYILKEGEQLGKFDAWCDEGICLGYSTNSHAFRVFNKCTCIVMEPVNVIVENVELCKTYSRRLTVKDEKDTSDMVTPHCGEYTVKYDSVTRVDIDERDIKIEFKPKKSESKILKNHPIDAIIGDIIEGKITRGKNVDYYEMVGMIIMAC